MPIMALQLQSQHELNCKHVSRKNCSKVMNVNLDTSLWTLMWLRGRQPTSIAQLCKCYALN